MKPTSNPSLWRVLAYTALFWLLRNVVVPATKYGCMLLFGCIFLLASPFILIVAGFGPECRHQPESQPETH